MFTFFLKPLMSESLGLEDIDMHEDRADPTCRQHRANELHAVLVTGQGRDELHGVNWCEFHHDRARSSRRLTTNDAITECVCVSAFESDGSIIEGCGFLSPPLFIVLAPLLATTRLHGHGTHGHGTHGQVLFRSTRTTRKR
jgi:hypothetical protein